MIADRQPIVLQGLKSVFAAQRDFELVASCSTGTSCLEAIRNLAPDVALLANTLPDLTVSEILAIAKAENISTRLVFFTNPKATTISPRQSRPALAVQFRSTRTSTLCCDP